MMLEKVFVSSNWFNNAYDWATQLQMLKAIFHRWNALSNNERHCSFN